LDQPGSDAEADEDAANIYLASLFQPCNRWGNSVEVLQQDD
jgi:hypothetical protein